MSEPRPRGSSRFPGFYKLSVSERTAALAEYADLTAEQQFILRREGLTAERADHMIENVIGVFGLPLGLAVNFQINGRDYVVPMAVEESSVVAAAGHLAKAVRKHGTLTADADEPVMIGQIQTLDVPDRAHAVAEIERHREELLQFANAQDPALVDHGGGAKGLETEELDTAVGPMLIVRLLVDVRDAMGANAVNTMCEALAPRIEELTGGRVSLRILSNLADRRLARARLRVSPEALSDDPEEALGTAEAIVAAWAFADADPHRAATHNKGIMNGMDPIVIATGNDWRAVEAGAHAYACREGRYRPLSRWTMDEEGMLVGELEAPMAVGVVGGATRVHPTARIALKILGVRSARELAQVIVSVGLVQNLAALRSLVTEGIQKGHMVLHARNVAVSAGAVGELAVRVAGEMIRESGITFDRAHEWTRRLLSSVKRTASGLRDELLHPEDTKDKEPRDPDAQ